MEFDGERGRVAAGSRGGLLERCKMPYEADATSQRGSMLGDSCLHVVVKLKGEVEGTRSDESARTEGAVGNLPSKKGRISRLEVITGKQGNSMEGASSDDSVLNIQIIS